jgi:hypothetical protein
MKGFWFRLKLILAPLGGYFGGRLLVLFLEKVVRLPFYAWQEEAIGIACGFLAAWLFCKKIDDKKE